MKGLKVFFLLLFLAAALSAQQSQPSLSLVTVYPGNAIYSAFGHTAFRYVDKENDIDILYNFGTFDFRDPKFVPKFVQGQLDYFLGIAKFKREYKNYTLLENRSVVEQKLNLTQDEIAQIQAFLAENALPENRYYKYDFIKDNCSTRIQTVLDKTLGSDIMYDQGTIAKIGERSYREYIRYHLKKTPWFDVGIQLALGMPLDQQVLPSDSFFLPALVHDIIAGSTLSDGRQLVSSSEILFRSEADPINDPLFDPLNDPIKITPPLLLFTLMLAVELVLIYFGCKKKKGWAKKSLSCYEYTLVVLNFMFGALIFYLWFISDHTATKGNLNILWCSPLSIVFLITFFLKGNGQKILRWFSLFMAFMGILFLLIMMVGLQTTCAAFIPLLGLYIILFGRRLFTALS
ncbi:MAG: DUF4105 domain-containing protein [Spirochaetia bacterium]|nr:DUF4105 domain-containing protein [Spirochaetia bacterium]